LDQALLSAYHLILEHAGCNSPKEILTKWIFRVYERTVYDEKKEKSYKSLLAYREQLKQTKVKDKEAAQKIERRIKRVNQTIEEFPYYLKSPLQLNLDPDNIFPLDDLEFAFNYLWTNLNKLSSNYPKSDERTVRPFHQRCLRLSINLENHEIKIYETDKIPETIKYCMAELMGQSEMEKFTERCSPWYIVTKYPEK
jgi:hypothetical protein